VSLKHAIETILGPVNYEVMNRGDLGDTCTGGVSRVFTGESGVRVTFKVLDSLSTAPRHAVNQAPQASGPSTHASGVARSPPVGGARSHGSAWFNRVENPEPISMATSDALATRSSLGACRPTSTQHTSTLGTSTPSRNTKMRSTPCPRTIVHVLTWWHMHFSGVFRLCCRGKGPR
jgi:hypothetical protein